MSPLAILALVFLILANGAFVAAEFAFVRARRERLEDDIINGRRGADGALAAIDELTTSLAACQLGITMTSLGIGMIGEGALARALEQQLSGWMRLSTATIIAVLISYLGITIAHITVGEQIPKIYALQRAEPTARWLARPVIALYRLLRPLVVLLNLMTRLGLRPLGIKAEESMHLEELPGTAELDTLISRAQIAGRLDLGEATMLAGVLDLHERQAVQVMTPLFGVAGVSSDASVREALECAESAGRSRLVVFSDHDRHHPTGTVHVADLAFALMRQQQSITDLCRDLHIVPESKPLDSLLEELQQEHLTLALVVDEYGGAAGIVTVEDIIEEIVGEIDDETDDPANGRGPIAAEPDGSYILSGQIGLHDLADAGLPDWTGASAATIGGLTFSLFGRLPAVGNQTDHDGWQIEVLHMEEMRVAEVRLVPIEQDKKTVRAQPPAKA